MTIQSLLPIHWEAVKIIYEEGIATGHATFETKAPAWNDWNASHVENSRLIAAEGDQILGWAALTAVSGRCVYAGVAEVSVYVGAAARGHGTGTLLLRALIDESERLGFWTLQASIFPDNVASLRLHLRYGFREVGRRERIGQLDGAWRDTILLERRSLAVG